MPIPAAMPVAEAPTASQVPAVSPSAPVKVVGWQLGVEISSVVAGVIAGGFRIMLEIWKGVL